MFVQDAMTRSVITVTPHTTLRQAAAVLSEHHITSLPVVAPDGQLLGVVGEADIVRESLVRDQRTLVVRLPTEDGVSVEEVEQVMTRQPITVRPDAELADAARVMADFRRKSLPVTDDGRVVGMISRADVVRQLARHDRQIAAEIHASGAGRLVRLDDRGGQRRRDLRGSRLRERSARCAAPGRRRRGCSRYPVPSLMRDQCVGSSRRGRLRHSADPVTPCVAGGSRRGSALRAGPLGRLARGGEGRFRAPVGRSADGRRRRKP